MKNKRSFAYVIWVAVGSMTAIAALMALLSIQSMQRLHGDFAELRTRVLGFQDELQRAKAGIQDARRGEKDVLLRIGNAEAVKKARAAHEKGVARALEAIDKASRIALDPKDGAAIGATAAIVKTYRDGMQAVIAKVEAGAFKSSAEADAVVSPVAQPLRDVEHRVDAALATADKQIDAEIEEFDGLLARQQRIAILLLGAIVVVGVGAAAWLARAVRRPLQQSQRALDAIAAGDLSVDVRTDRNDEFGDMLRALAAMTAKLRGLVQGVTLGVDAVGTASHEIAQGSQDLSNRTEEQASSLQQTAASMEQMAATVKHNADTASQASDLAHAAFDVAERGGTVFARVVSRMGEISASSRKIEEIIAVIDGIAFQTNILALNAAVEAARAGEQGRGFAVVAGEVRNLAQRSAQAAREIKGLITDSVDKVESGSTLVNEAGQTMSEIVQQVKRVTDLIGEITSATGEQTSGISQVNQAVSQLDQMTQQNAALVEQSAAAAQSLKQQADQLADAVAVFRLSRDEARAAIGAAQRGARAPVAA